ncbi:MAG: ABC transporter, branched-chain amino acid transport system ATP-binding protein [Candidatus Peregrinibacteria bacterium GW2011_GWF2_33_10]|nr:MAG: ABC transporter, branched-chain amino acid transport system ATP-binding protein [Candidatus Peregrinibacteria bacterium GW2011_GWF2_33_10]
MPILQVKNISKSFNGIHALKDLNFDINKGEIVGLIGPNGSGKSTFFNVLMNVYSKDNGEIFFNNINISNKATHKIAELGISRTFQDSKNCPQIKVNENLDLAFRYKNKISLLNVFFQNKTLKKEEKEHMKKIKFLLKKVGIENKFNALAKNLSYGQSKLLEILKIMASDAELILLDEPFSGLFEEMIKLISKLIIELSKKGKTIILIEHNMKLISEICDKVIVLDAGMKIAEGEFEEVKKTPVVIESYLGK